MTRTSATASFDGSITTPSLTSSTTPRRGCTASTASAGRAKWALTKMCDALALSDIPELQTLRKTLLRWRHERVRRTEEPD